MAEAATRPTSRRLSSGLLGVAGFFGGCGSAWVAGRWGCSPLMLAMLGLVAVPMAAAAVAIVRPAAGWRVQAGVWLAFVVLCVSVDRWAAHVAPTDAFRDAFAVPIPAGLGPVTVQRQYFDGFLTSLAFHANAAQIALLVGGRPFKTDDALFAEYQAGQKSWSDFWRLQTQPWVAIVKPGWPDPPSPATAYYEWQPPTNGDVRFTRLFWDAGSGQAYALCASR